MPVIIPLFRYTKEVMKETKLEKVYMATLLALLALIIVHAPLSVWLGSLAPDYALFIKPWKEILMLLAIPLACVIITKRHLWHDIVSDWLMRLIFLYVLLHLLLLPLFWQGLVATLAGLAIDLRHLLFFVLVYVAVRAVPRARRYFIVVAAVGAAVVVGFATLQLFLPADILTHIGYSKDTIAPYLTVDKNPEYIRVNSTLRGPNPLGAYAGMVITALVAAGVQARDRFLSWRVPLALMATCSAVALWISYSRSALVACLVSVLIVLGIGFYKRLSIRVWLAGAVILLVLIGGVLIARQTPLISHVIFHDNPSGGSQVSSNDEHVDSLEYGTGHLLREPFGSGVGSTGSASLLGDTPTIIENQYLFIGHEVGWLGLGLFLAIFFKAMQRLWVRRRHWLALAMFTNGIGLSLIGLLLPVWADDTVSIVWWGLLAVAVGGVYARVSTK